MIPLLSLPLVNNLYLSIQADVKKMDGDQCQLPRTHYLAQSAWGDDYLESVVCIIIYQEESRLKNHPNWKAGLDWVLTPNILTDILIISLLSFITIAKGNTSFCSCVHENW